MWELETSIPYVGIIMSFFLQQPKKGERIMIKLNRRQKKSLGKFFGDVSIIFIAVAVIGNAVKPDIPVIRSLIADVLAFSSAVIGFCILGTVDDETTPKK